MKAKSRQSGLTLMEQVVVIAAIALLVVFGLPAVRALFRSLESHSGAKAMISASLASARAIAAKEQHYAGIRFQKAYNSDDPNSLKAPQYMISIVHDFDKTGLANGFRAVEGLKPIKLPDSVGMMEVVNGDGEIDTDDKFTNKTTFSIIFSPSGNLVIHYVQTRNRDGESSGTDSKDDIFNTKTNVEDNKIGMFVQDSEKELSRNSFRIYDKDTFEKVDENNRWSDYLEDLEVIYINPYTGTMINR
jgi:Tfp pilus assembly protein FimT